MCKHLMVIEMIYATAWVRASRGEGGCAIFTLQQDAPKAQICSMFRLTREKTAKQTDSEF
jgi:hypothetical protein